jgi:SAM-dependent methyltransferase
MSRSLDATVFADPAATVARPHGAGRYVLLWRLWRRERENPAAFYRLLAAEAAESLSDRHGSLADRRIVDLGCGPGFYTEAFRALGAEVLPVDNDPAELAMLGQPPAGAVVADAAKLPLDDESVDGVFFSNALEHTPQPDAVIDEIARVLRPNGWAYISWTNWYSPWGGHDMSPYHYLGPTFGPRLYERRHGPPRKNRYGAGLYATYIGRTLCTVRSSPDLEIERVEPRYWPRLAFICRVPVVREVLTWNCVIHARKVAGPS